MGDSQILRVSKSIKLLVKMKNVSSILWGKKYDFSSNPIGEVAAWGGGVEVHNSAHSTGSQ